MTAAIRSWILTEYADLLRETLSVADDVTATIGVGSGELSESPRTALAQAIARRDLPPLYADVLRDARSRTERAGGPPIVPAPPYVTTTSRGPLLRLPRERHRLVIEIAVFQVQRDDGNVIYRREGTRPQDVLTVRRRESEPELS